VIRAPLLARLAPLMVLALCAAACGGRDPDFVTGRLLLDDRTGPAGVDVQLAYGGNPSESFAITDTDGRFSLEVPEGLPTEHLEVWLLTAAGVWGYVFPPTAEQPAFDFGDIPLWSPNLRVNAQPGGVEVDWIDMFAWYQPPVRFAVSATSSGTVWAQIVDTSNVVLDPRVLQDQDVTFTVSLLSTATETAPGLLLYPNFESPVGVTGTRVPLSRDMACQVDGTAYPSGACPITDGELTNGLTGAIAEIILDLGASVDLSAVTLHGTAYQSGANAVHFELSTDCLAYTDRATVDLEQYLLATWQPTSASCLKIRFDHALSSLDEIGVW
jgi:hypothetical protein